MSTTEKPIPADDNLSSTWWQALSQDQLLIQQCRQCKKPRHYPRPACDQCYSFEYEWIEATGKGHVHSWTHCHHAFHPAFKTETPYTLVTADLTEKVRLVAPLSTKLESPQELFIGAAVQVIFHHRAELTTPAFVLNS